MIKLRDSQITLPWAFQILSSLVINIFIKILITKTQGNATNKQTASNNKKKLKSAQLREEINDKL